MRDLAPASDLAPRPFGYFVHHQGRGHAERCGAVLRALHARAPERELRVFCARDDIFEHLPPTARITRIPSLFEPEGPVPPGMDAVPTPDTVHCAPLGWPGIRRAMAAMARWFDEADPALMISDVSAEVAQLSRLCSVPHVKVLQHGDRGDPGHRAAYDGAAGILAPFDRALAQPDWGKGMLARTFFAGGLGVDPDLPGRDLARARLGIAPAERVALVVSGGGGDGMSEAPLGVAARTFPEIRWITVGEVRRDWHATLPGNLEHAGWVGDMGDRIAAADLVVASTGNTTTARILAAGRPWIAVPEWRYFDEQVEKARALARAGAALHLDRLPASAHRWREAVERATALHDPERQRRLVRRDAAAATARWLEGLSRRLWGLEPTPEETTEDLSDA